MNERHWTRDWLGWLLLIVPVSAVLGTVMLVRDIGTPFGGYLSFMWINQSVGIVDTFTPVWWPGLAEAGLKTEGSVWEANGQPYNPAVRQVFADAAGAGESHVLILHDDHAIGPTNKPVRVMPFTWRHLLEAKFPEWISGLAFGLLALAVYRAQPGATTNRAFVLVASVVAIYRFLAIHSIFTGELGFSNWLRSFHSLDAAFVGAATVYFAISFPEPWESRWRRPLVISLFAYGAATGVIAVAAQVPYLPTETFHWNQRLGEISYNLMIYAYMVGVIALLVRLVMIGAKARTSPRNRRIALILFLGIVAALPMLILTVLNAVPLYSGEAINYLGGLDLRYLLIAVALAFAFIIIRYQSMQSPSRLFLGVLLLAGSGLLAGIAAWVWTLFQPNWPESLDSPPTLLFFAVALTSGMVWSLLANWRGALGRMFDWERHSYATTREFGRRIAATGDLKALPQTIASVLSDEMQLEQVGVWLRTDQTTDWLQLYGRAGERQVTWPNRLRTGAAELSDPSPFSLVGANPAPGWCRPLQATHFEVVAPMQTDGEWVGLIALGGRWDEEIFDDRDLELAEQIAQQATLFIVAAQTAAELRQMPGRMADVQEQERTRLAQELHDTIQQFLGRLPFYLAVSRDTLERSPERAMELLDRSISDVEEAAHQLRLIRHNLAPSQLQGGLTLPLSAMANQFQRRTGKPLVLTVAPDIDAQTSLVTRHAMYRVIQQALDNVEAHAEAGEVTVDVTRENGRVQFAVCDDGRGFSDAQRGTAQAAGSFGLLSMQARLESCGGDMEITSTPGQGTTVWGWVPVVELVDD